MTGYRVLVVDDKETMLSLFRRILPEQDVLTAESGTQALSLLASDDIFDVIVSDIRMPGLDGHVLLKEVKRCRPDIPVILMTAYGTVSDAVEAMKAGAFDYLVKPFDPDEAAMVVGKAVEIRRLQGQAQKLREELDRAHGFGPFVGDSEAMRRVYALIDKAAASEATVSVVAVDDGFGRGS